MTTEQLKHAIALFEQSIRTGKNLVGGNTPTEGLLKIFTTAAESSRAEQQQIITELLACDCKERATCEKYKAYHATS